MEEQNRETEIRLLDLWTILKRCWWQMLAALLVVAVAVYIGLSATHRDEYTAQLSIYVMTTPTEDVNNNTRFDTTAISIAANLIADCEELIKSPEQILRPVMVAQNLEGLLTVEDLAEMFSVKRAENARVLYLSVTSSSPERSAELVNALGERTCTYFNTLYDMNLLNVVDHALVPETPSNPISVLTVMLIALVAALLVYGIYFVRFIMDDKINTADDVERYLGLSMLGVIPNKSTSGRRKSQNGYYYSYSNGVKTKEGKSV